MTKTFEKVKRRLHIVLIFTIFTTLALSVTSFRSCADEEFQHLEVEGEVNEILDEFKAALPDGYDENIDIEQVSESLGIKRILSDVAASVKSSGGEISAFLITLVGIGIMSSLSSVNSSEIGLISSRAIGVVSAALLFVRLMHLISGAVKSLGEIGSFFAAVIPVCLAVNSLGVSPTTASTQAVGMGITLGAYTFISDKLLLPMVSAIFVASAASSFDGLFGRISKGIKSVFLWSVGIFTALVGATFSLQSVISASADNAAIRSARYAISGTIPMVGGAVSGILGVLSDGVAYARGVIGGGAIAAIVSIILSPLVTLLLYQLCLKAGIFFASVSSSDGCAEIISSFLGALDTLIAVYSLTSVIYVAELIAFLKGGAVGIA